MEPRFDAIEATVARMASCTKLCASLYPANGMMTSDGIGIHADCKAIRRKTIEYAAPADRPSNAALSFVNIPAQYSQPAPGQLTPAHRQTTAPPAPPAPAQPQKTARRRHTRHSPCR